jgi:spore coat protein E
MAVYKEIVTKAIIGKGKKFFENTYTITPEIEPNTILGCWVINHNFRGEEKNGKVVVDGSYDINIWYSHDIDTKTGVINKKINYSDVLNIKTKDDADLSTERDIIVRSLKQPNCSKVAIKDGNVEFTIEKELGVEIVGETKMKIGIETTEEPWDEVADEEELTKDIEQQIDENINEKYI